MPDEKPSAMVTIALFVIALLLLVPSGLCTGAMILLSLFEGGGGMISYALLIGGPFVAVGGLLLWLALARLRAGRMAAEADTKTSPPPA
jgi:hypothetical protein